MRSSNVHFDESVAENETHIFQWTSNFIPF